MSVPPPATSCTSCTDYAAVPPATAPTPQGWHYSVATPAVRSTVEALLRKQRVQTERIVSVQHPTPEVRRWVLLMPLQGPAHASEQLSAILKSLVFTASLLLTYLLRKTWSPQN